MAKWSSYIALFWMCVVMNIQLEHFSVHSVKRGWRLPLFSNGPPKSPSYRSKSDNSVQIHYCLVAVFNNSANSLPSSSSSSSSSGAATQRGPAASFLRFLDHTQWHTTVRKTPLDEWSARRRDLYLTTYNTYSRQISMPPAGFEPALDRSANGTGNFPVLMCQIT
jgi:hypothetical protein